MGQPNPQIAISNRTARVAELKRGTRIRLSDKIATVEAIRFLNGRDGSRTRLIRFNGRTVAALEVTFLDHDPVEAHLDQEVVLA